MTASNPNNFRFIKPGCKRYSKDLFNKTENSLNPQKKNY